MPIGRLALSRLSVIISSSLGRGPLPDASYYNETCGQDPCAGLQDLVSHGMVLVPLGVALVFYLVAALPAFVLRSRHKVYGVRSCLWVLIELWVHLVATHFIYSVDKVQAYAWAVHASAYILSTWQPKKGAMPYPGLQAFASLAGVCGVGLFAWQWGPQIGLAAWNRNSDAQCGWKVHLMGMIGVELVGLALGPIERVVVG
jgi:hypothetical protein